MTNHVAKHVTFIFHEYNIVSNECNIHLYLITQDLSLKSNQC